MKRSPNKQRKKATSNGCIDCAAMRISTFIITEQNPLSRIHSAARVIGASRGAVRVKGSGIGMANAQQPAQTSTKRHRKDKGRQFHTGILLADAGVRHVIEADPDTVQ